MATALLWSANALMAMDGGGERRCDRLLLLVDEKQVLAPFPAGTKKTAHTGVFKKIMKYWG